MVARANAAQICELCSAFLLTGYPVPLLCFLPGLQDTDAQVRGHTADGTGTPMEHCVHGSFLAWLVCCHYAGCYCGGGWHGAERAWVKSTQCMCIYRDLQTRNAIKNPRVLIGSFICACCMRRTAPGPRRDKSQMFLGGVQRSGTPACNPIRVPRFEF